MEGKDDASLVTGGSGQFLEDLNPMLELVEAHQGCQLEFVPALLVNGHLGRTSRCVRLIMLSDKMQSCKISPDSVSSGDFFAARNAINFCVLGNKTYINLYIFPTHSPPCNKCSWLCLAGVTGSRSRSATRSSSV